MVQKLDFNPTHLLCLPSLHRIQPTWTVPAALLTPKLLPIIHTHQEPEWSLKNMNQMSLLWNTLHVLPKPLAQNFSFPPLSPLDLQCPVCWDPCFPLQLHHAPPESLSLPSSMIPERSLCSCCSLTLENAARLLLVIQVQTQISPQ